MSTDARASRSLSQPLNEPALEWDIASNPDALADEARATRTILANAAKRGDWEGVFAALKTHAPWVNAARPGGASGFSPLHQAAYHGAPGSVVRALLDMGAWRLLRATNGDLPLDIAVRRGHRQLVTLLTPQLLAPVEPAELHRMEVYFHAVINGRAERLVREHQLRLPRLAPLQELPMRGVWMPVPGMFGGFNYWLERGSPSPLLVAESWVPRGGRFGRAAPGHAAGARPGRRGIRLRLEQRRYYSIVPRCDGIIAPRSSKVHSKLLNGRALKPRR